MAFDKIRFVSTNNKIDFL